MKTRDEVEELKRQWCADPCWDIETTDGFEEYRQELEAFASAMADQWAFERAQRLEHKARELGVPGNVTLARYVFELERRIEKLEKKLYGEEW